MVFDGRCDTGILVRIIAVRKVPLGRSRTRAEDRALENMQEEQRRLFRDHKTLDFVTVIDSMTPERQDFLHRWEALGYTWQSFQIPDGCFARPSGDPREWNVYRDGQTGEVPLPWYQSPSKPASAN